VGDTGDEPLAVNDDSTSYLRDSAETAGAESGAVRVSHSSNDTKPLAGDPPSPMVVALLALATPLPVDDRRTLARLLLADEGAKGDAG
jgi:hypothetical protein